MNVNPGSRRPNACDVNKMRCQICDTIKVRKVENSRQKNELRFCMWTDYFVAEERTVGVSLASKIPFFKLNHNFVQSAIHCLGVAFFSSFTCPFIKVTPIQWLRHTYTFCSVKQKTQRKLRLEILPQQPQPKFDRAPVYSDLMFQWMNEANNIYYYNMRRSSGSCTATLKQTTFTLRRRKQRKKSISFRRCKWNHRTKHHMRIQFSFFLIPSVDSFDFIE